MKNILVILDRRDLVQSAGILFLKEALEKLGIDDARVSWAYAYESFGPKQVYDFLEVNAPEDRLIITFGNEAEEVFVQYHFADHSNVIHPKTAKKFPFLRKRFMRELKQALEG